jgi:hypothetical protein
MPELYRPDMRHPWRHLASPARAAAARAKPAVRRGNNNVLQYGDTLIALDHLIVAASSLDAGSAWLESRLGRPLQPGGQHIGWGTHNRLAQLGRGTYLELIAVDPSQPAPGTPRPFGLDDPGLQAALLERPRLIHFVLRTDSLDATLASLRYEPGRVAAMTRGDFKWRITLPDSGRPLAGGRLPTLIQWDVSMTPADRLPDQGLMLERLEVRLPAEWVGAMPPVDDPRLKVIVDEGQGHTHGTRGGQGATQAPGLRAVLTTPNGSCLLDS